MSFSWTFPSNGDGEEQGFNHAGIDIWNGNLIFSLVRETVQNSLDARCEGKRAHISFSLDEMPAKQAVEITELKDHLILAQKQAKILLHRTEEQPNSDSDAHAIEEFYDHAINLIETSATIPIFAVQDFGTTGLTGSPTKAGKWRALVKGAGISDKDSDTAGGSYGHGAKAPFSLTAIRSIFYLTKFAEPSGEKMRFQGKSVLQSMDLGDDNLSQGTGYFGLAAEGKLLPIEDSEIPKWALDIRHKIGDDAGTSVLVPFPQINVDENFWLAIKMSVLSSFYISILQGFLEIRIDNDLVINDSNLVSVFDGLLSELASKSPDELDEKSLDDLEASKTVHLKSSGLEGVFDSKTFGEVKWFFRSDENCGQGKVSIARQSGMLITRSAPFLLKFPNSKPFELFVIVNGPEGSKTLREFENPAHTAFEFDRVKNENSRIEKRAKYKAFTEEIRKIIKEHAALEILEEAPVDDFDEFFKTGDSSLNKENGNEVPVPKIEIGRTWKPRPQQGEIISSDDDLDPDFGRGQLGGDGARETKGGEIPDPSGESEIGGRQPGGKRVKNLRVVRESQDKNLARVSFTPVGQNSYRFQLYRSGDSQRQAIQVRLPKATAEWQDWIERPSDHAMRRVSLILELHPEDFDYAFEGLMIDAK